MRIKYSGKYTTCKGMAYSHSNFLFKFQMFPFPNPAVFFCYSCLLLRSFSFLIVIDYYIFIFVCKHLPNASPTLSFFFSLVFTIIYLRSLISYYFAKLEHDFLSLYLYLFLWALFYVLFTKTKNKKINSCVILVVDNIK